MQYARTTSHPSHPCFYGKPKARHDITFIESVLKRQGNDI